MAVVPQGCGWAWLPRQPENPSPKPLLALPVPSNAAQGSLQQLWHALTIMAFHQIHEFLPQASSGCQLGWAARFWPLPRQASPSPHGRQWMAQGCLWAAPSPAHCCACVSLVRAEVLPHSLPQFVSPVQSQCDWSPRCSEDLSLVAELALVWFFIECQWFQFTTWKLKFFLPVIQCPYPVLVLAPLFIYLFKFRPGTVFDNKILMWITRQIKRMLWRKTTSAI